VYVGWEVTPVDVETIPYIPERRLVNRSIASANNPTLDVQRELIDFPSKNGLIGFDLVEIRPAVYSQRKRYSVGSLFDEIRSAAFRHPA
jgi:hypothetical protein